MITVPRFLKHILYARSTGTESVGIEDVSVVGEPVGFGEPPSPSGAGQLFQRSHFGGWVDVTNTGTAEWATILPADHPVLSVPSPAGRAVQRHVQQHRQPPAQGQTARLRVRRLPTGRFTGLVAGPGQRR